MVSQGRSAAPKATLMPSWQLYPLLTGSAGLIIWGCEYISQILRRPELAVSWLGVVLLVVGTLLGMWTCYVARRGAVFLGVLLLAGAGAWAWNARPYFDPERVPGGVGPPLSSYVAVTVLILLGVLFAAFFRYLYPRDRSTRARLPKAEPRGGEPEIPPTARSRGTPWYRLGLLVAAAAVAIAVGRVSGIEDPGRTQLTIIVLVLGCLATGLISEETLVKLVPGRKE